MKKQIQFTLIAFNSLSWIKATIDDFFQHFPNETLLVVDDNPDEIDIERWKEPIFSVNRELHFFIKHTQNMLEESKWLADIDNDNLIYVSRRRAESPHWAHIYLTTDKYNGLLRQHGFGMGVARGFCLKHNIPAMCHFEPDCKISGRNWFNKMREEFYSKDLWLVGGTVMSNNTISECPAIYLLEPTKHLSFLPCEKEDDVLHPLYEEGTYADNNWGNRWDTSQKISFYCQSRNKANVIDISKDFIHYWHGANRAKSDEPRPNLVKK